MFTVNSKIIVISVVVSLLGCNQSSDNNSPDNALLDPQTSSNTTTTSTATTDTSNLSLLFATPSTDEVNQVLESWQQRNTDSLQWQTVATTTDQGFTLDIVSQQVNNNTHYSLVRYPKERGQDNTQPVLIINHGGTSGVASLTINQYSNNSDFDNYTLLLPSFPGEVLDASGIELGQYQSEGDISEFDYDIDTVIALLNGALDNYPWINPELIAMIGGSRGGCVSYLTAIREPRVNRMVVFFGATDHITFPEIASTVDAIINQQQASNPFFNTITSVAESYLNDTISLEEARFQLLSRSPLYFIDHLPTNLQIHHGALDSAVPVENSQLLDQAILQYGNLLNYEYYEYPDGGHGDNMPNSTQRGQAFILQGYFQGQ